jgi:hypothetical protein
MQKALAISTVLVVIFAIPRGLDFSDEGLYVLLADPRQENIGGIFNYDLFFKFIFRFTGLEFGIKGLRILRLLSYFLGALSLSIFWKNIQGAKQISSTIFLLALAGLFAGYGFLPLSLSYNSISVVGVCLWLGIISKRKLTQKDWLWLGIVFLILFYAKVTVCLVFGFLTLIYFGINKEPFYKKLVLLVAPFLILECLFFILFQDNALLRLTGPQGFLQQRQDYGGFLLIKYTAVGIFWSFLGVFMFWISGKLKQNSNKLYYPLLGLAFITLILVFYWTRITAEWSHIFLLSSLAYIVWYMGQSNEINSNTKTRSLIFILLAIPFLLHFGSNVYWMRLGIHYWVFWIFATALLIQNQSPKFQQSYYQIASGASLLIVIIGVWISPFEGKFLWQSNHIWKYKEGKEILLSVQQIEILRKLEKEIGSIKSEKIASLYMNPGILYLLDRHSPHIPGYWKPSQAHAFLGTGGNLDMILFNQRDTFPFDQKTWIVKDEMILPNGDNLQVLWRK